MTDLLRVRAARERARTWANGDGDRLLAGRFSRRQLLHGLGLSSGVLAGASLLAACSGGGPAAPPAGGAPTTAAVASPSPLVAPSLVAAAASPSAAASAVSTGSVAAPADWQAQWDTLLAAAKQEGTVSVIIPPGDVYQQVMTAFQDAYGIQVQALTGNGNADIDPRVENERTAGQYNWDAIAHSPGALQELKNSIGALDPLMPALLLPEVLDDSAWFKGFASGWDDKDATSIYAYLGFVDYTSKINRTLVPETQLSQLDQLWDSSWKGQIAMFDPRIGGAGQQAVALWYLTLGPDKVRQFLQEMQPAVTQDRRQLGEWVIRGEYPIGVGIAPDSLATFIAEGVDTSMVQPLEPSNTNGVLYTFGTGSVGLFNHAPHPHAAQVFANWVLSQQGQAAFSKDTGHNSRRLDVPVFDPLYAPDPSQDYINIDLEVNYDAPRNAVAQIAKEELS